MKELSCIYNNYSQFKSFLVSKGVDAKYSYCVFVYVTEPDEGAAISIAKDIRSILPNSAIHGTTTSSFTIEGIRHTTGTLVCLWSFDKSKFNSIFLNLEHLKPAEWALELLGEICTSDTKLVNLTVSDRTSDLSDFVDEFNKIVPDISLFGGSSDVVAGNSFIFDDKTIYHNALYAVSVSGSDLKVFSRVLNNVEPIGEIHEVTKVNGYKIYEIDNKPILTFFYDLLGKDILTDPELDRFFEKFSFISVEHQNSVRCLQFDPKQPDCIQSRPITISEGEKIRLGFLSNHKALDFYSTFFDELEHLPLDIFTVSVCNQREKIFSQVHKQISKVFANTGNIVRCVNGEFGNFEGCNEVFAISVCFLGLTENSDKSKTLSFDRNELVVDEIDADDEYLPIYNRILKHQTEKIVVSKEELLKKIYLQEQLASRSLFVDKNTNLYNVEKFSYDCVNNEVDKLCLVSVVRSAQIANYIGHDSYVEYFKNNINLFRKELIEQGYLDETGDDDPSKIRIYVNDASSFLIVAPKTFSTELFMKLLSNLYVKLFKHETYNSIVCFNAFYVIVDETEDLLDKAKYLSSDERYQMQNFVVYERSKIYNKDFEDDLLALAAVNYAIEKDGIEPFFQPIHDNADGKTHKFESLMRIRDANGKLWFPNQFLPVSKEFKLYENLSNAMIQKVFDLFDERSESVSINLSAIDINSKKITEMIYCRLGTLKHPEHFIFEILESDAFDDINVLSNFIQNLRTFKVQIAIDDFGAGYSNLLEIVKLKPDIIKIDGEIIKHLLNNEVNRKMMDVIIHMARTFDVDLVAEYAENKELQDYLFEKGIRYSQGYYFSKPLPYAEIDKYLALEEEMLTKNNEKS